MSEEDKIKATDTALARYYKQQNVPYNGQFVEWAEENGFDADGIQDELDVEDPTESSVIEFDENFPGNLDAAQIMAIVTRCWTEPDEAYTNEVAPLTVTADDWNITEQEKKDTIAAYAAQCKTIFDGGMKADQSIINVLAVGQKLNQPYLQFLADMYSRDRLKSDSTLQPADWAIKNKHCKELKSMKTQSNNKPFTETVSAVGSFFHRIVPKLMLNTQTEIVDSIEQTAKYIAAAVDFVSNIAQQPQLACPFQVDTCIAFNEAKDCSTMAMQGIENEDDDEDDDDEDDVKFTNEFYDCFGNIKDRLKKEKLLHTASIVDDSDNKENVRSARMFQIPYQKFKNTQIAKKYGKDKDVIKEYPRKHRFCSLIDRRKPDKDGDKGTVEQDEMIFFEPPNNCNTFPADNDYVPLWYFDTSRTCIIPNIGYEHGKHLGNIDKKKDDTKDAKEKVLTEPVTSQSPCKGALLVLSFHVESEKEIRAYLYLNGQITRFFPEDIKTILPRFFKSDVGNNATFAKSKIAQDLVDHMTPKLRDIKFEAFYNEYKNK